MVSALGAKTRAPEREQKVSTSRAQSGQGAERNLRATSFREGDTAIE